MRTVYLNGRFVPESEAKLSIYDLSVMQAAAAFEMTRSFNGVQFKLREHIDRLVESCRLLSIPLPAEFTHGLSIIETLCLAVQDRNDHGPGEEHRLLIVVSPGAASIYKDIEGTINHPFVYIADFPLRFTVAGFCRYFTEGVHCVTSKIRQVPNKCVPARAKHRSRLHFHLAQQQAPAGTWPILLDDGHDLCEAPGANLVGVWYNDADAPCILTYNRNALPGISLQTIKELCRTDNREGIDFGPHDELWLTGTPFCMLPVVSLDGKPIGEGKPGPVFKETLAKWSKLVGVDIQGQIESWDAARS